MRKPCPDAAYTSVATAAKVAWVNAWRAASYITSHREKVFHCAHLHLLVAGDLCQGLEVVFIELVWDEK